MLNDYSRDNRIYQLWQAYWGDYSDTLLLRSKFNENVKYNYLALVADIIRNTMLKTGIELVNKNTDSVIDVLEPVQTVLNEGLSWLIRNGTIEGTVAGRYTDEGIEPLTTFNIWQDGENVILYKMDYTSRFYFYNVRNQWVVEQQSFTGQEILNRYLWPYEQKPYFMFFHKDPLPGQIYGSGEFRESDITDIQAINFLLGNALRIVRYQANKRVVGTGFNPAGITSSPDGTIVLPNGANMYTLDTTADLTGTLALKDTLVSSFLEAHSIPPVVLGQVQDVGKLSSLALEVLYGPLIRKIDTLRTYSYTPALRKILEVILLIQADMGNIPAVDIKSIDIKWPELVMKEDMGENTDGRELQRSSRGD